MGELGKAPLAAGAFSDALTIAQLGNLEGIDQRKGNNLLNASDDKEALDLARARHSFMTSESKRRDPEAEQYLYLYRRTHDVIALYRQGGRVDSVVSAVEKIRSIALSKRPRR